jgi:hypothetical protein
MPYVCEWIAITNFMGYEKNSALRTALFWVITQREVISRPETSVRNCHTSWFIIQKSAVQSHFAAEA